MDDLARFCCQNPDCPDYGLRGRGNLRVCFYYGPGKSRRMLACRTCQDRFSERKGTALFGPSDRTIRPPPGREGARPPSPPKILQRCR